MLSVLSAPTLPAADAQSRWQPGAGSQPEAAPPACTKQQQQQQQQQPEICTHPMGMAYTAYHHTKSRVAPELTMHAIRLHVGHHRP
jgi:hypothetical protein